MSEKIRYLDDYFFITWNKTIETPYENRVRFAMNTQPMFLNEVA